MSPRCVPMAQTGLQVHVLRTTAPPKVRFHSLSTSSAWGGPPVGCLGRPSWSPQLRHHFPNKVSRPSAFRAAPTLPPSSSALRRFLPIDAQDWQLPPALAVQPPETTAG